MQINNRDKTILLMGTLGYPNLTSFETNYNSALSLMENNQFDIKRIIKLHYDLQFDEKTEQCHISLAGSVPTIKIKSSDVERIVHHLENNNIKIDIG